MFSSAYAAGGGSAQGFGVLMSLLPFLLIFLVMYLFMVRPQQKRNTAHKAMLSELKKGDCIITIGGILGTIQKVDEVSVFLEISDGVTIFLLKSAIANKHIDNSGVQSMKKQNNAERKSELIVRKTNKKK
ncbi:MAG: preprotein translocase subunit YajC [Holosporales bacterium]|jgi:preprotein translocase subunit YajC|nr:preprotein translocase subunit YajC [Holosporales bacterium]